MCSKELGLTTEPTGQVLIEGHYAEERVCMATAKDPTAPSSCSVTRRFVPEAVTLLP